MRDVDGHGSPPRVDVVLYTETVSRGGAEVALRNLTRALDASVGVTVMGVDREVCEWIAEVRPGTPVVVVPAVRNKASVGAFVAHRRAIARLQPDVFHANLRTMGDAQYAILAALSVRGTAVIAVEQLPMETTTKLSRWLNRRTGRQLAAHVAVGERAARLVEAEFDFPVGSVQTIYNGVPDVGAAAARHPGPTMTIGTFARLDWIKGLDVLLGALPALPRVRAVIAGDGPDRDAIVASARRNGLDDRVHFAGWVEDPRPLFDDVDVFVLPSRNEGFPLSIVEAMLAERPVIATDVGSVVEAVEHGVTGLVVPADDVDALRAAIDALARDPERRGQMGRAGRARALERFTADAMARGFEEVYGAVTSPSA